MKVVLVTADLAAGEALALACGQRGVDVDLATGDLADVVGAEVLVLDCRSEAAVLRPESRELRPEGVRRVVKLGWPRTADGRHDPDAWVTPGAGIDDLVGAITGMVADRPRPRAGPSHGLEQLTPREGEVVALLLANYKVAAMSEKLGVAASTVRTHLRNIYEKLGVNSQAEVAAWALQAGFEPFGDSEETRR